MGLGSPSYMLDVKTLLFLSEAPCPSPDLRAHLELVKLLSPGPGNCHSVK